MCQKIFKHYTVAVNLSPALLKSDEIVDVIISAIRIWDIDPSSLIVEVTEESIMKNPSTSMDVLQKISEKGVSISIDDLFVGIG